jgi:hypothetical protein
MTDFAKATEKLFQDWIDAPTGQGHTNWSPSNQRMKNLWCMMSTGAFTHKHICDMLVAINQLIIETPQDYAEFADRTQALLTKLCKAKVLRSRYVSNTRMENGQRGRTRFYEVNY